MKKVALVVLFNGLIFGLFAQQNRDFKDTTIQSSTLPNISILTTSYAVMKFMPEVSGTMIFAAKKNALVNFAQSTGNKSSNNMRELLARVPGIHIWESDAGGVQTGIATRGLSPNRNWEFNVRQNGFDIAADPYGYPEAYYNPPSSAIQEMEITRGTAALQYGPQFGGLINYKLKKGDGLENNFDYEFEQSYSTANIFNSFTGLGFKGAKRNGYVFFNHKGGDGWRQNSKLKNNTLFATASFQLNQHWSISPEWTYFNLISQQPGGLKDDQLYRDSRQSVRSRNWMGVEWIVPGVSISYQKDSAILWETKFAGNFSSRNSIFFNPAITTADTINANTNQFANRNLQRDRYENFELESRVKKEFGKISRKHVMVLGIRLFSGNTNRLADGKGSTGADYDLTVLGNYNKSIAFKTANFALFSENVIRLNDKLLVTIGSRLESIQGKASGRNGYTSGEPIMLPPQRKNRLFLLMGTGFEYHFTKTIELYGSATQCYRPVLFSHLLSPPGNDVIDPNLKDSKGYVIDLGWRSKSTNNFNYDFSVYYLRYANKIGSISQKKDSIDYRFLTNIGDSYSMGIEAYIEWKKRITYHKKTIELNWFSTYAFNHSRYVNNIEDPSLSGKWIENAPRHILRSGVQIMVNNLSFGYQFSYTDDCFSDAINTVAPSANAQLGIIPAYSLMDLNLAYSFNRQLVIRSGINNVADRKYFTRRTGGLPGPGAIPADGRVFYFSLVKKLK
jgi:Fe(3+) dicitrate transport protein